MAPPTSTNYPLLERITQNLRGKGANERTIHNTLNEIHTLLQSTSSSLQPQPQLGTFLSDIVAQPLTWLWEQRIPQGHLTYLDADPGIGTSLFALHLAACISSGSPMPDGTPGKQGNVILLAPHDHPSITIKPRLEAAGGDPSHVLLLTTVPHLNPHTQKPSNRPFSLTTDLQHLENTIQRVNALLVLIDLSPSTPAQETSTVLTALSQLSHRTGCAIVFIRSARQRDPQTLLPRDSTSRSLAAIARSTLLLTPDPTDDQQLLLLSTKNSFGSLPQTLTYHIAFSHHGIPTMRYLGESPTSLATLRSFQNPRSLERQQILQLLQASPTPLSPQEIAERTGQNYTSVRQTLHRMQTAHELTTPARGFYTTPTHTAAIKEASSQLSQPDPTTSVPSDPPLELQSQSSQSSQSSQLSQTPHQPPQTSHLLNTNTSSSDGSPQNPLPLTGPSTQRRGRFIAPTPDLSVLVCGFHQSSQFRIPSHEGTQTTSAMWLEKRQVFSLPNNPLSTASSWNWPSRGESMSEAAFHELEHLSPDRKYEYLNGKAYLMSGGSVAHDRIMRNVGYALDRQLQSGPCRAFGVDVQVLLGTKKDSKRHYVYPDATVSCDAADRRPENTQIASPHVVLEVLSPSTEARDRGMKFKAYQRCPTIQEIVLLSQFAKYVEIWQRDDQDSTAWHYRHHGPGEIVEINSINVQIDIEDAYQGLDFAEAEPGEG